jgi:hypothetical protein
MSMDVGVSEAHVHGIRPTGSQGAQTPQPAAWQRRAATQLSRSTACVRMEPRVCFNRSYMSCPVYQSSIHPPTQPHPLTPPHTSPVHHKAHHWNRGWNLPLTALTTSCPTMPPNMAAMGDSWPVAQWASRRSTASSSDARAGSGSDSLIACSSATYIASSSKSHLPYLF